MGTITVKEAEQAAVSLLIKSCFDHVNTALDNKDLYLSGVLCGFRHKFKQAFCGDRNKRARVESKLAQLLDALDREIIEDFFQPLHGLVKLRCLDDRRADGERLTECAEELSARLGQLYFRVLGRSLDIVDREAGLQRIGRAAFEAVDAGTNVLQRSAHFLRGAGELVNQPN
ncbi:hypothetical protein [Brucella sp. 10RB9210]|uniref:hypothetical protein n=1 Tax=Brucella sp. 10RB9210 TaxID=1844037 RepID=UPI0012AE604A|nr:hypothetical protein [Brucella sp. 10RB9210]MRN79724.1 hypothetical protein [Brucella sp. 10RB9210]